MPATVLAERVRLVRVCRLVPGERGQDPAGVCPGGSCRPDQLRTRGPGAVRSVVPGGADTRRCRQAQGAAGAGDGAPRIRGSSWPG